ncbi:MAG: sensor histidine kinase [Eubacteriales bacterium]
MNETVKKKGPPLFLRRGTVKTLMIVLFILSLIGTLVTGVGLIVLTELGVYSDPSGGSLILNEIRENIAANYAGDITAVRISELSLTNTATNQGIDWLEGKNFDVSITDELGKTVYRSSGWDQHEYSCKTTSFIDSPATEILEQINLTDKDDVEQIISDFCQNNRDCSYQVTNGILTFYRVVVKNYKTECALYTEPQIRDMYVLLLDLVGIGVGLKTLIPILLVVFLCLTLFMVVLLIWVSGWRIGADFAVANPVDRIPYDLYLVFVLVAVFLASLPTVFWMDYYDWYDGYLNLSLVGVLSAVTVLSESLLLVSLMMSTATRIKLHRLFHNTLIRRFFSLIGRAVRFIVNRLPVIWIELCAFVLLFFLNIFLTFIGFRIVDLNEVAVFLWIVLWILAALAVGYLAWNLKYLYREGKRLAEGRTGQKIPTDRLYGGLRRHAEHLNQIGEGMEKEISERMKSERMKTELITNVSHDIKTPLTSIINYVDLLKKEGSTTETGKSYLEVLDCQTNRLKKLIEDLIQASKASTGNLELHLMVTDVNLLSDQVLGEYRERLSERNLTLVQSEPLENAKIQCDGQYLWRIFDNLLSNICKYSLPGTRVYYDTERRDGKILFVFRNISAVPLHISPDELTERFVRGDASRTTEGSGLGLSIAKSLAELQSATLVPEIDGDLFKVTLTFPEFKDT